MQKINSKLIEEIKTLIDSISCVRNNIIPNFKINIKTEIYIWNGLLSMIQNNEICTCQEEIYDFLERRNLLNEFKLRLQEKLIELL
ncbi:MAG: hypothetical protein H7836_08005 [Magnetococcus sp. YQC-3]